MNPDAAPVELDLYQDVVMDHKRAPRHFGTLPGPRTTARAGRNPSCGDDVRVALDVAQGRIRDIRFEAARAARSASPRPR